MSTLSAVAEPLKRLLARIAQQDRSALRARYDTTAAALLAVAQRTSPSP